MKLYLQKDGKQAGPFRDSLIRKQLASGELTGNELAWHKSITQWQPLREIFPAESAAEKTAPAMPTVSTPLPMTQPASATASPPRRRLSMTKTILLVIGGIFALLGLLIVTVIVSALIATRHEHTALTATQTTTTQKSETHDANAASVQSVSTGPIDPVEQYSDAAKAGDVEAQYRLAMAYMQKTAGMSMGDAGTSEYAKEAAPWFRKAAEQGDARAQFQIGNMYFRGWGGLPGNDKQAVIWIRKAAEQGNADGQFQLGEFYEYSKGGLAKNMVQAVALYREAAEQGQPDAECALGDAYQHGRGGLPKDTKLANEWLRKAAAHGNDLARRLLE